MGIKICGRTVRWQKPIKTYTLVKTSHLVVLVCALTFAPAFASETTPYSKASTGASVQTVSAQDVGVAPANKRLPPQPRTQRTAGTPSMSPALAIAMALGLRSVPGPVERRPVMRTVAAHKQAPLLGRKEAYVLPGDGVYKKPSSNAAGIRMALED